MPYSPCLQNDMLSVFTQSKSSRKLVRQVKTAGASIRLFETFPDSMPIQYHAEVGHTLLDVPIEVYTEAIESRAAFVQALHKCGSLLPP